jgi:hypothetical protein
MGMSSPTPPSSPAAASAWLAPPFLLTAVLVLVSVGTTWGVLTTRMDAAERARSEDRSQLQACTAAVAALQVRAATVESEQVSTKRLIDTEMAGVRRELERLAKGLERLLDAPTPRAHR